MRTVTQVIQVSLANRDEKQMGEGLSPIKLVNPGLFPKTNCRFSISDFIHYYIHGSRKKKKYFRGKPNHHGLSCTGSPRKAVHATHMGLTHCSMQTALGSALHDSGE